MTPRQKLLVQSTFELIRPFVNTVAAQFYRRLFQLAPELRPLFKGDLDEQSRRFARVLTLAVDALDRRDEWRPLLEVLGDRHVGYGVREQDYRTAGAAWLSAMRRSLGGRAFNREVRNAWAAFLAEVATAMTGTVVSAGAIARHRVLPPLEPGRRRFLKAGAALAGVAALAPIFPGWLDQARAAVGKAEKPNLRIGFIKLTDMVPLAIAYEKGYFADEGLSVTLEAQSNWKLILDRTISGELDGAHMLAGQPIAATIGFGTQADMVTAFSMDLNGNGITVSNAVWAELKKLVPKQPDGRAVRPIQAKYLKRIVDAYKKQGRTFKWGVVFPVSTHNYELRYWLASGGIHPGYYAPHKGDISGQLDADVLISVTPPPQMPATLEAGTIDGYCVGEPWNQQAVFKGIGVPVITDYEIWKNNPEKVFGVTRAWAEKYPNTHVRVVKALIRAAYWLDAENNKNRKEASQIIARPNYVGADYAVIANSMTGTYEYEKGEVRKVPDFNTFFRYHATYPYYSDAIWYLTQMRRWGQIPEARPDSWYIETAKKVYRPDIYALAAKELIAEGKMKASDFPNFAKETGFKPPQKDFIDGMVFDGRRPNEYINKFKIGLKGNDKL